MTISSEQSSLLTRTLGRMREMHQQPTAFILGLSLRANDCPLELADIREWLAEHENDTPEKDMRGAKFLTAKPATATDPGADEEKNGVEQKMAGNTATAPANAQPQNAAKNWMEIDDENSSAGYIKFVSGDRKVLKIVTNPIAGPIDFKQPDGTIKTNFGLQIDVMEGDNPEIKNWKVTSKSIRDQLKGICRNYGLGPNLAGSVLRVMANGDGLKRTYFVELLQKPGQAAPQIPAQPAPTQDPGAAWLQQQRQGAQG